MASIFPVRCFSCGKQIGSKWDSYEKLLKEGQTEDKALDSLKMRRFCCRRMFLSHVPEAERDLMHYTRG